jgi:hypothetical protein
MALQVDAPAHEFVVVHGGSERRRVPIRGVQQRVLPFDTIVAQLAAQARTERRALRTARDDPDHALR